MSPHRRPHALRLAHDHDDAVLSDVLARSFWDDPVMGWMMPDDASRYRKLRHFYRAELSSVRRRGEVITTEDLAGAALWCPPGKWRIDKLSMVRHAPALLAAFGTRIPVALKLLEQIETTHPAEPHWYLAILGTDPSRQGLGVGARLITTITDRCDHTGVPAYLESSKPSNVPYYARFGFEVTHEVQVPGSPTLYGMWRPAR